MLGGKPCVLVFGAATTVIVARSLGPAGRGSLASSVAYALVLVLHLWLFARDLGGWSPPRPTVAGATSIVRLAPRRA